MLGVCLLYVGIVLINNGIGNLMNYNKKSMAVMNFFTGGLSVVINVLNLIQGNYYGAATGLLFGFIYLFVGINCIYNLQTKLFSWFSTFVAINAFIFGTFEGFLGIPALGIEADIRWAIIWYLWGILCGAW